MAFPPFLDIPGLDIQDKALMFGALFLFKAHKDRRPACGC